MVAASPDRARLDLRADCGRCAGLCCVAPAFSVSADFAIDKPAGVPCPNLGDDFRCSIHSQLRGRGFPGCAAYDCFGAGQRVAQVTFAGRDWREDAGTARAMFAAFGVMRRLHQLLWYVTEALELSHAGALRARLRAALEDTERLTEAPADALQRLDVEAHRRGVDELLRHASELERRAARPDPQDRSGADLIGAELQGADLRAANLRGVLLVGADLRGADLRQADLIGADLRGADVRGADLGGSLFLTQPQADSARGDAATRLPGALARPTHWGG
ncbi:MAG: pentapeptide repeat-containing protein [Gaiellales bacterium]